MTTKTRVFDPEQFGYSASKSGYMLTYRGKPIGGAGVKPPGCRRNTAMFAEQAKSELVQLKAGCGQARFWTNIHMIERERPESVKVTPTMLKVLRAIEERPGCGANLIASTMWPDTHRHMSLRAGQYVGKLVSKGLVRKHWDEYRGQRGQMIIASVSYNLTNLAQEILNSER